MVGLVGAATVKVVADNPKQDVFKDDNELEERRARRVIGEKRIAAFEQTIGMMAMSQMISPYSSKRCSRW